MKIAPLALLALCLDAGLAETFLCDDYMSPLPTGLIDGDVEVPESNFSTIECLINGQMITGRVKVKKGSLVDIRGAVIGGNVEADDDSFVTIGGNSTVSGDVKVQKNVLLQIGRDGAVTRPKVRKIEAKDGSTMLLNDVEVVDGVKAYKVKSLNITNSSIGDNVEAKVINDSSNGTCAITDTSIGGDLKVEDSYAPFIDLALVIVTITGDVDIKDNTFDSIEIDTPTGVNTIGDDMHPSNVKIEYNDFRAGNTSAGQYVVSALVGNIMTLKIRKNEFSGGELFLIAENEVSGKIEVEENDLANASDGLAVVDNCAGDSIKVKKNEGVNLGCENNKPDVIDCSMGTPPTTIEAQDNVFDNFPSLHGGANQCIEPVRRLRH